MSQSNDKSPGRSPLKSKEGSRLESADESRAHRSKSPWHYTPALPVNTSPYFKWPLNFPDIGQWILNGWFPISERLIILLFAIVSSIFFQPTLAEAQSLSPGWIAEVFLRNFFLMVLVAGGLHWYFYICLLYTSPSPRDATLSRMPSSA